MATLPNSSDRAASSGILDAENFPRITPIARSAAGAEFQFATQAGAKYRLEGTEDLASGQWTTVSTTFPALATPSKSATPNAAGLPQYFYRILLP